MENNREAKKRRPWSLVLIVLLLVAITLHAIPSREAVPDHAKFVYDDELQIFIPSPQPGKPAFYPVAGKFKTTEGSLTSKWDGVATWEEIKKKDGRFRDYRLPQGEGWDDLRFYGDTVPLWKRLFFNPPSRWDDEGHWRY